MECGSYAHFIRDSPDDSRDLVSVPPLANLNTHSSEQRDMVPSSKRSNRKKYALKVKTKTKDRLCVVGSQCVFFVSIGTGIAPFVPSEPTSRLVDPRDRGGVLAISPPRQVQAVLGPSRQGQSKPVTLGLPPSVRPLPPENRSSGRTPEMPTGFRSSGTDSRVAAEQHRPQLEVRAESQGSSQGNREADFSATDETRMEHG